MAIGRSVEQRLELLCVSPLLSIKRRASRSAGWSVGLGHVECCNAAVEGQLKEGRKKQACEPQTLVWRPQHQTYSTKIHRGPNVHTQSCCRLPFSPSNITVDITGIQKVHAQTQTCVTLERSFPNRFELGLKCAPMPHGKCKRHKVCRQRFS